MQLLVAAAADQTGRTITFLTMGLVGIAVALTALTVWYWRFSSPKSRMADVEHLGASSGELAEPPSTPLPPVDAEGHRNAPRNTCEKSVADSTAPVPVVPDRSATRDQVPVAAAHLAAPFEPPPPVAVNVEVSAEPTPRPDDPFGLDADQWEVLAQAVFAQFIDDSAPG